MNYEPIDKTGKFLKIYFAPTRDLVGWIRDEKMKFKATLRVPCNFHERLLFRMAVDSFGYQNAEVSPL